MTLRKEEAMWVNVDTTSQYLEASKQNYLECYQAYDQAVVCIEDVIDDIGGCPVCNLEGAGYTAIKNRLEANECLYAQGLRDYHSALLGAHATHLKNLQSYFPEGGIVDGETIQDHITGLEGHLNTMLGNPLIAPLYLYSPSYNSTLVLLDCLKDKLMRLSAYSANSQYVYSNTQALAAALSQGAQYISGISWCATSESFIGSGDESWRTVLKDARKAVQDEIRIRAREGVYSDELFMFGGNQEQMEEYFKLDYFGRRRPGTKNLEEYILANYIFFKDLRNPEIKILAEEMSRNGCGYIAVANSIAEHYYFRPAAFERDFGFPLFREEGGKQLINFELIAADLFCYVHQNYYYNPSYNYRTEAVGTYNGFASKTTQDMLPGYIQTKTSGRESVEVLYGVYEDTGHEYVIKANGVYYPQGTITSKTVASSIPTSTVILNSGIGTNYIATNKNVPSQPPSTRNHAVVLTGTERSSGQWDGMTFRCSSWGNEHTVVAPGGTATPSRERDAINIITWNSRSLQ